VYITSGTVSSKVKAQKEADTQKAYQYTTEKTDVFLHSHRPPAFVIVIIHDFFPLYKCGFLIPTGKMQKIATYIRNLWKWEVPAA
jgi:hypothetical protein